ncbi:MAG: 23S rRNA (adenine(2503)-C(2))-methyltransferase RlmN [Planctomycetes bacterium]|nr:23S rRNA (adenine(2503)-C(2))-methyltransferase RlmN [Planctomycetota bacterium]
MKPHLLDMTIDRLREALCAAGEKAFRAEQLADWVYKKGVSDAARMSNVPRSAAGLFDILTSAVASQSACQDGCVKLLLNLRDATNIETVLICADKRATACLSTQVGCAMGCAFCASAIGGFERNLSCGEILEQILHLQQAGKRRVTNVVFMGMGEPLANYDATVAAARAIIDPDRFGISARRVTISTVGLPREIRRLAGEDLPVTLAISLHAPNDSIRRELIPSAKRHAIGDILDAAGTFYDRRHREITIEYMLMAGVNDSTICADALADLIRPLRCNVNLLRYNPVASLPYERPSSQVVQAFAEKLRRRGINANIRRSRGLKADAACGQLRCRFRR